MVIRLVLALVLALPLAAQLTPARIEQLERAAARHMSAELVPALSVSVVAGDSPIWSGAWGFADLENHVPATPRTVFRLASVAKPFTAVAAMLLVEQGRLKLDAPVQDYVPFPRKPWTITMRHLLSHQSGIRHYRGDEFNSTKRYTSVGQALEIFARDPLEHEPGTRYLYSTYGFNLAGAVVESAAGMPYDQWVRERVLAPAGIAAMQPDDVHRLIPRRARGYRRSAESGLLENCALADTSNKVPGGGWVATAEDLVRFARALMEGELLTQASLKQMWTPAALRGGKPTRYGLGWNVYRQDGQLIVEHSGGQQGTNTHLWLMPERRMAIAVLANLEAGGALRLARELAGILSGAE